MTLIMNFHLFDLEKPSFFSALIKCLQKVKWFQGQKPEDWVGSMALILSFERNHVGYKNIVPQKQLWKKQRHIL